MLFLLLLASEPQRFDHFSEEHQKQICNDCHVRSEKDGWAHRRFPDKRHRPCEDAGCHAKASESFDPGKPQYCNTCHPPASSRGGANLRKVVYPPYRSGEESQFGLVSTGHGKHVEAVGDCAKCHRSPDMELPGHAACISCHAEEQSPKMDRCEGCHVKKEDTMRRATVLFTSYRVSKKFSHRAHKKKSRKDTCEKCHLNVKTERGAVVPLPAMKTCTTCHDGDQAFDALGSDCQRCHQSTEVSGQMETASFSHARHADQRVVGPNGAFLCNDCHPSTERGRLWFVAGGRNFDPKKTRNAHWPCSKCHLDQFATRETKGVCSVCHQHSDPWRTNPSRERFRTVAEMPANIPHEKHEDTSCNKCHFEQTGDPAPEYAPNLLAPTHELCGECHETLGQLPMTKCDGCHHPATALEAPTRWSVAAKFSHEKHQKDVRAQDAPLACVTCHVQVDDAPRPTMKSCHQCHDGSHAFKDTGFDCARCHGPVSAGDGG